jgi:hypothetical protein
MTTRRVSIIDCELVVALVDLVNDITAAAAALELLDRAAVI